MPEHIDKSQKVDGGASVTSIENEYGDDADHPTDCNECFPLYDRTRCWRVQAWVPDQAEFTRRFGGPPCDSTAGVRWATFTRDVGPTTSLKRWQREVVSRLIGPDAEYADSLAHVQAGLLTKTEATLVKNLLTKTYRGVLEEIDGERLGGIHFEDFDTGTLRLRVPMLPFPLVVNPWTLLPVKTG